MKSRLIQIWILLSVLLIGCHKLESTTQITPDGSGKLRTEIGFSAEERENLEKENNHSEDFCNTVESTPDIIVTEEQRDDETWCITTASFNNLEELRDLYEQRNGITINKLEIVGGTIFYDIDIDTLSEDSSFFALSEITWTVIFPDAPINHNADSANGSILTWTPIPQTEIVNIRAQSRIPEDTMNSPNCQTAFIGVFAILIYLKRKEKKLIT